MSGKNTHRNAAKPAVFDGRKIGPETRERALRLLAEGFPVTAIAQEVGCNRSTVRLWRDSPEGDARLKALRRERDAQYSEDIEDARRALKSAALDAVKTLVQQLRSTKSAVAVTAAQAILDRIGVPRTERVETVKQKRADFSKLTTEELRELKRLRGKLTGES